jgi:hypothetical protein
MKYGVAPAVASAIAPTLARSSSSFDATRFSVTFDGQVLYEDSVTYFDGFEVEVR